MLYFSMLLALSLCFSWLIIVGVCVCVCTSLWCTIFAPSVCVSVRLCCCVRYVSRFGIFLLYRAPQRRLCRVEPNNQVSNQLSVFEGCSPCDFLLHFFLMVLRVPSARCFLLHVSQVAGDKHRSNSRTLTNRKNKKKHSPPNQLEREPTTPWKGWIR